MRIQSLQKFLSSLNRIGGKLFFRVASIIPVGLLVVVVRSLIESFNQQAYGSAILLLVAVILLALLIRYLWSRKRSVADIFEANS